MEPTEIRKWFEVVNDLIPGPKLKGLYQIRQGARELSYLFAGVLMRWCRVKIWGLRIVGTGQYNTRDSS